MARKWPRKGAKALAGLLKGCFESCEVHLGIDYSCFQEVALKVGDDAEVHPLRHGTKPLVHVP